MLKSALALITRPNLRSNPQLASIIPFSDAIEYKVLVLGVNSKELKVAVADSTGCNYLLEQMQRVDFQRVLARVTKTTLVEVSRLVLNPQYFSIEDIEKGIMNSYQTGLEVCINPVLAGLIPREDAERYGILLEKIAGFKVCALYTDGNGKQILEMKFNRYEFRQAIAQSFSLKEKHIDSLTLELNKVSRIVLDREIHRAYPEQRYEGFTSHDTRRYSQAVRKEWINQAAQQQFQQQQNTPLSNTKQVFYDIVASGYKQEASDVRIYYDLQHNLVLHDLFLDGEWRKQTAIPLDYSVYQSIINLAKSDAGIPNIETYKAHDGDIHFKILYKGKLLEFDGRVCIFPHVKTRSRNIDLAMITIRILRQNEEIRPLSALGLLPFQLKMVEKFVDASTGLLPVCGVMNSGKNGTLMSLSAEINAKYPGKAFLSLEDPVETDIPFAFQTQVARHRGMKTSDYLPSILRSNVQVIQMGEINNADKADFAIRAAQSGHYTQCTIHAKSPFDVIPRLQLYGLPPSMIGEVLIGVIYQKLVPKLCQLCAVAEDTDTIWDNSAYANLQVVLEHWKVDLNTFKPKQATGILNGKPCPNCSYQGQSIGYRGRIGVFEIWDASFQRKQLQDNIGIGEVRSTALKLNHWTILRSALCYVQAGVIDLATAIRVYNGIDPTYEGVPGYRFEDYEKYARTMDDEVNAYKQTYQSDSEDIHKTDYANHTIIDAEIVDLPNT